MWSNVRNRGGLLLPVLWRHCLAKAGVLLAAVLALAPTPVDEFEQEWEALIKAVKAEGNLVVHALAVARRSHRESTPLDFGSSNHEIRLWEANECPSPI